MVLLIMRFSCLTKNNDAGSKGETTQVESSKSGIIQKSSGKGVSRLGRLERIWSNGAHRGGLTSDDA